MAAAGAVVEEAAGAGADVACVLNRSVVAAGVEGFAPKLPNGLATAAGVFEGAAVGAGVDGFAPKFPNGLAAAGVLEGAAAGVEGFAPKFPNGLAATGAVVVAGPGPAAVVVLAVGGVAILFANTTFENNEGVAGAAVVVAAGVVAEAAGLEPNKPPVPAGAGVIAVFEPNPVAAGAVEAGCVDAEFPKPKPVNPPNPVFTGGAVAEVAGVVGFVVVPDGDDPNKLKPELVDAVAGAALVVVAIGAVFAADGVVDVAPNPPKDPKPVVAELVVVVPLVAAVEGEEAPKPPNEPKPDGAVFVAGLAVFVEGGLRLNPPNPPLAGVVAAAVVVAVGASFLAAPKIEIPVFDAAGLLVDDVVVAGFAEPKNPPLPNFVPLDCVGVVGDSVAFVVPVPLKNPPPPNLIPLDGAAVVVGDSALLSAALSSAALVSVPLKNPPPPNLIPGFGAASVAEVAAVGFAPNAVVD